MSDKEDLVAINKLLAPKEDVAGAEAKLMKRIGELQKEGKVRTVFEGAVYIVKEEFAKLQAENDALRAENLSLRNTLIEVKELLESTSRN